MPETPMDSLPEDPTLEEIQLFLAPYIAEEAAFDGWSDEALTYAAEAHDIDPATARLAYPDGAMDMIDAWIQSVDAQMQAEFTEERLAAMKIREKITELVWYRICGVIPLKEALRRAVSIMAQPQNAPRSARISWRSADLMWRMAGDTATDYNHYTKRTILMGVYSTTLMCFLDDESDEYEDTRAFLERRIDNVMQFEKAKAKFLKPREGFDLTRFLGRLRYRAD
ncbi:MAG: COQ9 family protein [Pseudomonadota bacterium]